MKRARCCKEFHEIWFPDVTGAEGNLLLPSYRDEVRELGKPVAPWWPNDDQVCARVFQWTCINPAGINNAREILEFQWAARAAVALIIGRRYVFYYNVTDVTPSSHVVSFVRDIGVVVLRDTCASSLFTHGRPLSDNAVYYHLRN